MSKNYSELLSKIETRQNPENDRIIETKLFENLSDAPSNVKKYIKSSMNEVDDRYTQITLEAGEQVKKHLQNNQTDVCYRYQGSVMTQTHIKGYSDIDLLTISEKFFSYDLLAVNQYLNNNNIYNEGLTYNTVKRFSDNFSPYQGNVLEDLRELRLSNESIMKNIYSVCDLSHAKAIKITNLNLHRDVDIVTASWYDDINSIKNDRNETYRGIQIYDKSKNIKCNPDYPFLSIDRINTRSSLTQGRLKKMIRFLKNLKSDSEQNIKLSSFDLNAICYNIEVNQYKNANYLELVAILFLDLYKIANDVNYANKIPSVDGYEYIFKDNSQKYNDLKLLLNEVYNIYQDLTDTK